MWGTAIIFLVAALTLHWQDNSNNEEAFVVEIRIGGQGQLWEQEAIVPANVTEYPLVFYNTRRHCYRVRAYNQVGESGASNVVCASVRMEEGTP